LCERAEQKKTRGGSVKGEGEECIQEITELGRRAGFSWNARL